MPSLPSVSNIREHFIDALKKEKFVTDKTGVKTIELVGASFLANEPTIFGTVNDDYTSRELRWYLSKSLFVKDIPGGAPKIWQQVASKNGEINSNYGWAIYSHENCMQYAKCRNTLEADINSRRAIMIYTRPTMQNDFNRDGMSDFMCTNAVQYLVRDGVLHAVVQMRSNDVVFGYKNDRFWQDYVLRQLAEDLRLRTGDIHWQVGSLHVYERHFDLVK